MLFRSGKRIFTLPCLLFLSSLLLSLLYPFLSLSFNSPTLLSLSLLFSSSPAGGGAWRNDQGNRIGYGKIENRRSSYEKTGPFLSLSFCVSLLLYPCLHLTLCLLCFSFIISHSHSFDTLALTLPIDYYHSFLTVISFIIFPFRLELTQTKMW